jgi:hypothetical protein
MKRNTVNFTCSFDSCCHSTYWSKCFHINCQTKIEETKDSHTYVVVDIKPLCPTEYVKYLTTYYTMILISDFTNILHFIC